jgi:hypothetical protein
MAKSVAHALYYGSSVLRLLATQHIGFQNTYLFASQNIIHERQLEDEEGYQQRAGFPLPTSIPLHFQRIKNFALMSTTKRT